MSSRFLPQSSKLLLKLLLLSTLATAFSKLQFPTLLIKAFEYKVIDIREFPPTIDTWYICCSIAYYKIHAESCFAIINTFYCYCKLFVQLSLLAIVLRSNTIIMTVLNNHIINLISLNYCD